MKYSPWGAIQDITQVADGIAFVSTPSHGGYKLDKKLNAKIPKIFRDRASIAGGWYEEDCAWSIVAITFPQFFPAEALKRAHESAKYWFKDEYSQIFGDTK
jgi:hypothetical protein